jgi:hypothetical protein
MIPTFLRPWLAQAVAPFVTAFFMWLGAKAGHAYDPEFLNQATLLVVEGLIWAVAIFWSLSGVIAKLIASKTNPHDSATPPLSERGTQ